MYSTYGAFHDDLAATLTVNLQQAFTTLETQDLAKRSFFGRTAAKQVWDQAQNELNTAVIPAMDAWIDKLAGMTIDQLAQFIADHKKMRGMA